MEKQQINDLLLIVFSKVFFNIHLYLEKISSIDLVNELGMDSVTFISLIIEIESQFHITISDDYLLFDNFRNYNRILDIIYNHLDGNE